MKEYSKHSDNCNKNSITFLLPGSLSLMADLSRPFASSDEYGDTTLRPGQLLYHAAKHCECWAATPEDGPFGPRNTIGT